MFIIAFSLGSVGALLLSIFYQNGNIMPVLLMFTRFGISQAFVASYLSIILLFPTKLTATTMGICNVIARVAAIIAPFIAEVKPPINLIILLALLIAATLLSQLIIVPKENKPLPAYSEMEEKSPPGSESSQEYSINEG